MSKQNEIPTTAFVMPFMNESMFRPWADSVSGFCNGLQSVKQNETIRSLRAGNLVYLQGWIEIKEGLDVVNVLPVSPRESGFIQICDSDGNMKGLKIIANTKAVDLSIFGVGTYYISGQYIAESKKKV